MAAAAPIAVSKTVANATALTDLESVAAGGFGLSRGSIGGWVGMCMVLCPRPPGMCLPRGKLGGVAYAG